MSKTKKKKKLTDIASNINELNKLFIKENSFCGLVRGPCGSRCNCFQPAERIEQIGYKNASCLWLESMNRSANPNSR